MLKAGNEAENNAILSHLHLQRTELLDHYIRAQKLALSSMNTSHRKYKGMVFNIWDNCRKECIRSENAEDIRGSLQEMTGVKRRIKRLEDENS